ncbi:hypothetical protein AAA413_10405, partial [Lactobacillus crispatus]
KSFMKEFFFLYVFFCSNQSYEKGTPFSNVLRNKFKELFILTQNILQSLVAAYDREKDVIYVNKGIYTHQIVKSHLKSSYFVAKDMRGILWHEYGYKLHWDAVKSFYKVHKSKYNDIY